MSNNTIKINTKKVKQLLIDRGMSQKEVAEKLGVHPTAFSAALSNHVTTYKIASNLARILSTSLEVPVHGFGQMFRLRSSET